MTIPEPSPAELGEPSPVPTEEYAYPFPGNPNRDEARALAEFNRELQRAVNNVDWTQPW